MDTTVVVMDPERGNGKTYENGHTVDEARAGEVVEKQLGTCFSFIAMVMAVVAVAVVASIKFDTTMSVDMDKYHVRLDELLADLTEQHTNMNMNQHGSNMVHVHQPVPTAGLQGVAWAYNNMGKDDIVTNPDLRYESLAATLKPIGAHQELLCEASDAGDRLSLVQDGMSGDTDFPHGNFTAILTIGEYDAKTGYIPVGVPDGQGVYLKDMSTVRVVFQAESYGHMSGNPSWYLPVNKGKALFTGSHIAYVDYKKDEFKAALEAGGAIAPTVVGAGELFDKVFNLAGKEVDATSANPHYGDTSADGTFVTASFRSEQNEWTFHSFCSAHLEEKHQWGAGIGLETDTFLTVEEWTDLDASKVQSNGFVGLSAHAVNMETKEMYAVGAFGMGGYEKIVEFSCGVPDFTCFAISGYNGNFGSGQKNNHVARKAAIAATRSDGSAWVYPQDIVPARVYIGSKGYKADGTACGDDCDYLAKNGLAFGRVYGFSVPDATPDRDPWHKTTTAPNPRPKVDGVFAQTAWQWDGVVRNFEYDQAWDFQEPPTTGPANYKFWTAKGRDSAGAKTEHNSPDPRGGQRYIQGSTAGYMGIYAMSGLKDQLAGTPKGTFPASIDATYELIEGETDITQRIVLGGKGKRADGGDQTKMRDSSADKSTFEDIDGLEWFAAKDGRDFVVIQEDGGNWYGERTFLFELPTVASKLPEYYFLAQSGGAKNTRMMAGVSIPAGTHGIATAHEFSGASDFSGTFTQTELGGQARREAEMEVDINDKYLCFGLQAHSINDGVVKYFGADRGGQLYAFKPNLP